MVTRLIKQFQPLVAFDGEPNHEDDQRAKQDDFQDFSQDAYFRTRTFCLFASKILYVLREVADGCSLTDTPQPGILTFATTTMLPLKKFMKHERSPVIPFLADARRKDEAKGFFQE